MLDPKRSLALALLLLTPGLAFAQGGALDKGDTAWVLTCSALVLFMTLPGLALFYGGLVRTKNVLSVLMQCFSIAALVSVLWLLLAYSLTFTDGGGAQAVIGGLSNVLLAAVGEDTLQGSIPASAFSMFQLTFAIITPALVAGAFAERMRFSAVLWFAALWLLLVYVPTTHWVWGGGWLGQMGLMDFAGGTVVHLSAGVAALVTALVLGPRTGFPTTAMPPHNLTMSVTGAGMLWVGWFGFNGGSALAANGDAAMAVLVTHLAAASAVLSWAALEWFTFRRPTVLGAITGMVAGLGTITPASGFVGPGGAFVIGLVAGAICFNAVLFIKRVLKIDDSLDVFPVHGVGGILGTLLTGIFGATTLGIFAGQGLARGAIGTQLGVQALGVLAIGVWCAVVTYLILKVVDAIVGLRVTTSEEQEGLDLISHEERGYDL